MIKSLSARYTARVAINSKLLTKSLRKFSFTTPVVFCFNLLSIVPGQSVFPGISWLIYQMKFIRS
jgi:hypothetical protein